MENGLELLLASLGFLLYLSYRLGRLPRLGRLILHIRNRLHGLKLRISLARGKTKRGRTDVE